MAAALLSTSPPLPALEQEERRDEGRDDNWKGRIQLLEHYYNANQQYKYR